MKNWKTYIIVQKNLITSEGQIYYTINFRRYDNKLIAYKYFLKSNMKKNLQVGNMGDQIKNFVRPPLH